MYAGKMHNGFTQQHTTKCFSHISFDGCQESSNFVVTQAGLYFNALCLPFIGASLCRF